MIHPVQNVLYNVTAYLGDKEFLAFRPGLFSFSGPVYSAPKIKDSDSISPGRVTPEIFCSIYWYEEPADRSHHSLLICALEIM